jgi:carboxymethylenebutenolidase
MQDKATGLIIGRLQPASFIFAGWHLNLQPRNTMSEKLVITTAEGSFDCYVARPDVVGTYPVIIVLQEIFGVNEGIRSIADSYAAKGYIAVAPDLFWRNAPGVQLWEGNEADVAKAFELYKSYDFDHGVRDIAATISAARTLEGASGKVGVTGYCLGGLMTYLSATRTDGDAFAAYYGGGTDQYLEEANDIGAPILYHLAGDDAYIKPDVQEQIKAALADKLDAEVHIYPGCDHAFARPGGSHYDEAAARLANSRTDEFFARTLR